MTSPYPDPPSRPPHETLDRLIDLVAWARTCLLITAATPPGSPGRLCKLEELRKALVEPRHLTDEILGSSRELPQALLVSLRVCELAIPKLEAGAVLRTSLPPKSTPESPT